MRREEDEEGGWLKGNDEMKKERKELKGRETERQRERKGEVGVGMRASRSSYLP